MTSSRRRFRSEADTGRRSRSWDSKKSPEFDSVEASECNQPAGLKGAASARPAGVVVAIAGLAAESVPSNHPDKALGSCNRDDNAWVGLPPMRDTAAMVVGVATSVRSGTSSMAEPAASITRPPGEGAPPTRATIVPASGNSGIKVNAPLMSRDTCSDSREYSETPGIGRLVRNWSPILSVISSPWNRTVALSTDPTSQRAPRLAEMGIAMARSARASNSGSRGSNRGGGIPTGLSMAPGSRRRTPQLERKVLRIKWSIMRWSIGY